MAVGTNRATRNNWATWGDGAEGEFDRTAGLRTSAEFYIRTEYSRLSLFLTGAAREGWRERTAW